MAPDGPTESGPAPAAESPGEGETTVEATPEATEPPLAAVVAKPAAERAIDALRAAGVYDDGRRIAERDEGTVAVPVTVREPAAAVDCVRDVVAGAPTPRRRGLESLLRARGADPSTIAGAPASWGVVGDVVLADLSGVDGGARRTVGEALRELHGAATVLDHRGVEGPHREPDATVVCGERTRTVHVEHGTEYALDLAAVMFSPGNQAERVRMGVAVDAGDRVLDCFAGVGYFALPMARAGAHVTAVERNPTAHGFLIENAARNGVTDRLRAVRADCRELLDRRSAPPYPGAADRIVLGHFETGERVLPAALDRLRAGGTVHLHALEPAGAAAGAAGDAGGAGGDRVLARTEAGSAVGRALAEAGRSPDAVERRIVKGYSEGVDHVVWELVVD